MMTRFHSSNKINWVLSKGNFLLSSLHRLNSALVDLDHATQEKNESNNKLLDQIRFIGDLQREINKHENANEVANSKIRDDLRYEKEVNYKLKEELKKNKLHMMRLSEHDDDVTSNLEKEKQDLSHNLRMKVG